MIYYHFFLMTRDLQILTPKMLLIKDHCRVTERPRKRPFFLLPLILIHFSISKMKCFSSLSTDTFESIYYIYNLTGICLSAYTVPLKLAVTMETADILAELLFFDQSDLIIQDQCDT